MGDDRASAPRWLREALGPDVREPRRLRWGFTHETWAASVGGRELVATRMVDTPTAQSIVEQGPELVRRLAEAGIRSPVPDVAASRPDLGIVVADYIEGTPGIEAMGDEAGARRVGRIAGGAWLRLASVDPSDLHLDDLWAHPGELRVSALEWLRGVESEISVGQASVLRDRVTAIASLLAGRRAGFVHGDLVPVNLLVRDAGLCALLDLEAAHVGEPLLDAAWFSWIVRYHHRELEPAASDAFASEAGIVRMDERTSALLVALPSVRILEILARRRIQAEAKARWLNQLRANSEP